MKSGDYDMPDEPSRPAPPQIGLLATSSWLACIVQQLTANRRNFPGCALILLI
ncbi:MAG: hypothetical protein M0Z90_05525 [Desulfobacteraceae bacterium]|nr:hypothetical protein [Desulfobacteraceae bacterium]